MEWFSLLLWTLIVGAIFLFYLYYKVHFWARKGIPHLKPVLGMGNSSPLYFQTKPFCDFVADIYNKFQSVKYFGIMDVQTAIAVLRDPELVKETCVKNFDHFHDHQSFVEEETDPIFSKNLLSLRGERWKEMRSTLSPVFTTTKIKFMFELIEKCAQNVVEYFLEHPEETDLVESKDVFSRYSNDVIATAIFGITINSLQNRNNEFFLRAKDAAKLDKGLRLLQILLTRICPQLLRLIDEPFLSRSTDRFFKKIIRESVKIRDEKKITRPDMIQLLMEARDKENGVKLTVDDIIAQAFVFLIAGFDTTSTTMCFIAHELAVNPKIQEKLRNEVDTVLESEGDKISYEALSKMKYLHMVVSETLRKYPPIPAADRRCTRKFTFPKPTQGSKEYTAEPNSIIWIPIQGFHNDPKYFPEPEKYDPERFSDENKGKIQPYTYFPFGLGPRKCIASRFALIEIKVLFVYILRNFTFERCEKTVHPVKFKKSFSILAESGSWIRLTRRNDLITKND